MKPGDRRFGRRILTDEEKRLWELVAQTAQPLHPGEREIYTPPQPEHKPAPIRLMPRDYTPAHPLMTRGEAPLASGAYAGIDRNTAERFRKGEYPFDGTLDLHGMTREKAHRALGSFLHSHYERGSRCLLVITGKGQKSLDRKDMQPGPGHGILREMLPVWLSEPGLRAMVLALDVARQKHGGSGAYYIRLRPG